MKLARPDVFHPRIVLAGWPQQIAGDGDDAGLVAALRRRGLHARWLSWDDPETFRADLVILRATRDYPDRLNEFLRWTGRVPSLLNPPEAIAWNVDTRYLRDLERANVPTLFGSTPAVGGHEHRAAAGKTALVFFGGVASHGFTPAAAIDPDFQLWDLGRAALEAAADQVGIGAPELLYARVDVAGEPGDARVVCLDLVAPSLGWAVLDRATRVARQRQFVLCVESALERLGLGPFRHRGL
ncbi:hypothetical protein [Mycobacterium riyadhense]|uniref:Cycloserine biosynthesis protein DcsG n=1 Tax=Mycobacterium riyadhense TaxID=486698 RepID=A0A653EEV7_9MYCO|nr:hypothetical protein [Mycobacterium riyadhense]VTO95852.1 hypothetical protein BIN_B_01249 [Mycobacterium riyadhense]